MIQFTTTQFSIKDFKYPITYNEGLVAFYYPDKLTRGTESFHTFLNCVSNVTAALGRALKMFLLLSTGCIMHTLIVGQVATAVLVRRKTKVKDSRLRSGCPGNER